MLGGKINKYDLKFDDENHVYGLTDYDENNIIETSFYPHESCAVFTIEEFFEKYPYKIGDIVLIPDYESPVNIIDMDWNGYNIIYVVLTYEEEWFSAVELILYKKMMMLYKKLIMTSLKILLK